MRRTMIITISLILAVTVCSGAEQRKRNNAPPATAPVKAPAQQATELALDDGKSAGKQSIAGSGHAVLFESPVEGGLLTAIRIFGSRYGTPQPPAEDFHIWLCDEDGKQLKQFDFPYKTFLRGEPRWVKLATEPTQLPKKFMICVGFDPEQTKGVYVHFDKQSDGDSRLGLPGSIDTPFAKGDWMIRALVANPSSAKSKPQE